MFKMYFVKTDKPNVFHRVDALARVLFNEDIYYREDCLTQKQSTYYDKAEKENLPQWNEIIGFTDDYTKTVEINKPIPEMIQTAKDMFDINLCFVDERPNIPYDPNIIVDVKLDEGMTYGTFCYWISFGKFDMTDTLAIIDCSCEVYDRIRTALEKYHFGELEECIVFGNERMNPELEEIMKKDFKENFNINLHVKYCNPEDYKPVDTSPETTGIVTDVDNESTQKISFVQRQQWSQSDYYVENMPEYNRFPDVPIETAGKVSFKCLTITMPDQKQYAVTFRDITIKNDETHPSVICYDCKNIMPYVDETHEPFDINELLEKLNNPELCKDMYVFADDNVEYFKQHVEIMPEYMFKCTLMNGDTVMYDEAPMNPDEMFG